MSSVPAREIAAVAKNPHAALTFDEITRLAAALCHTSMAAVRLTEGPVLQSETAFGWHGAPAKWEESVCPLAAQAQGLTVIEDAKRDARFANAGYVVNQPYLRFYAAAPLVASDGGRLGVLCVMDPRPRTLDDQERDALKILADYVAARVELLWLQGERSQTEHRLRVAVESADLGTFHWTLPDRTFTWDARCKSLFGLPAGAKVSIETLRSGIHPDDRAPTFAAIDAAINDHAPYDHAYRTIAPDGRVRWVHANGRAFYDGDGTPRHFDGVIREITRQTQTEADLRRATARLESMLDAGEVAAWSWDIPSDTVTGDRNLEAMFGVGSGRPLADFVAAIHTEDRDRVGEQISQAIATGQTFASDYRLQRADGSPVRWVQARGRVHRNAEGHPVTLPGVLLDITDRVLAEQDRAALTEELRRKTLIYDIAVSEISDYTYVFDRQRRFVFANRRILKLWQKTLDQAVGRTMEELEYAPEITGRLNPEIDSVFATGKPTTGEVYYASPDGTQAIYEHVFSPVRGPDGSVELVAGSSRDVTARLTTERALRESEARFRFLSDLGDATRDLTDPNEVLAAVSRRLGEYLGVSRCAYADVHDGEAFTIRYDYTDGCASTVGDYTLGTFGDRLGDAMRSGRTLVFADAASEFPPEPAAAFLGMGIAAMILCPLTKGGRFIAMMAVHQTTPRQWTEDEIRLVQVVVERCWSYLEQAQAIREKQETFERLRLAQQAGRVGSFDWMIAQDRLVWTPELEAIYGLPEGSFDGTFESWGRHVLPADLARVNDQLRAVMARGERDIDYEFRIILPDGRVRWISAKAHVGYDAAGKPSRMIGVNYDTTEQHDFAETREALLDSERSARAEAERVSHMKDEFLATLSHELRTPLNAILGWSQILRTGHNDAADLAQGLDTIERNARAQSQIIEDLLDMSRIISGKIRLDVQGLDVSTVIQAAAETVRPAADAKGVRLQVVLDPNTGPVSGDPGRLQQVFWNLLSNAIKFTPKGGRVQVRLERVDSHLEMSFSDTGQGIKKEFLPYVFDRFRQADATTTRHHGGLGIGLALVKQLVELHGGTVTAKSQGEGRGATFTVMLPLTILHPDPVSESPRRHPGGNGRAPAILVQDACVQIQGVRVLVIDDEPDARGLVRRLLTDCHAVVECAGSAAEAIEKLDGAAFDVIVSDIGMPGEDGYSLIRRIRQRRPERGGQTPAVALTAYARSEDRMRSVVAGFQMHIPKPVEPAELITMVASLAGRTGAPVE